MARSIIIAAAGRLKPLFGNLKTKGFNMEDTHITDRDKLSTLLVVLAMAVALSAKTVSPWRD